MRLLSVVVTSVLLAAAGCKENSVTEPPPVQSHLDVHTVRDLAADTANAGVYTFFSLRDSVVLMGADTATGKWDIAFAATRIRTNSGASGPGQGGAIVLTNTDFDTLAQVPTSGYATDTTLTQTAIQNGSDRSWYHYDFTTNIISPIAGRVLVIRTADGRYAKVQILNYYLGAPAAPGASGRSRFFTFRYVFQPDGSARF
jgi:hypothetical protein